MKAKYYNVIVQGYEVENAIESGYDKHEYFVNLISSVDELILDEQEQNLPYLTYEDTLGNDEIDVYYDYSADYYCFTKSE